MKTLRNPKGPSQPRDITLWFTSDERDTPHWVEVEYVVTTRVWPAEPRTYDYPGYPAELEWYGLRVKRVLHWSTSDEPDGESGPDSLVAQLAEAYLNSEPEMVESAIDNMETIGKPAN